MPGRALPYRALCAIAHFASESLNVFRWTVTLTVYCAAPPSNDLTDALHSIPELSYVPPVVDDRHLRYVRWEIRSRCDPLDELDEHIEDVLARLRTRHAQLHTVTALGGEVSLDVRCAPPPDVIAGLLIEHRHVAELGTLRASISLEVVGT